jgi:hypothetical protein
MKNIRIVVVCMAVALAGSLLADDGTLGSGGRSQLGSGGKADDGAIIGTGAMTSLDDGGLMGSGGRSQLGSGGKEDGGGTMGSGNLTEYVDEHGSRFFVVAFDDGSWFAFGVQ